MKYVILRDDDANATTPPWMLERLYRPFLDRGMPVHLAAIPEVCTDIRGPDGELEGFLLDGAGTPGTTPIGENRALCDYVRKERGYVVMQHGLTHEYVDGHYELDRDDPREVGERLDRGLATLERAGFARPTGFVAPQDQISRSSLEEVTKRFGVLSTQYLSVDRVPRRHWPGYLLAKKVRKRPHFRLGRAIVLTHPGCILSHKKPIDGMVARVMKALRDDDVNVVVSHHWEYFGRDRTSNEPFIAVLHALAERFAANDVKVVSIREAEELAR